MNRFVFYEPNLVNTITQLYFSSNSGTASNLYDRDESIVWQSSGENSDVNTATISILFASRTNISCVLLQNHNFKGFNIIYNSNPTNQFNPGVSVTANANSNTCYEFATQAVTSIDINCWSTFTTDAEKKLGEIVVSKGRKITFDTNPPSSQYKVVRRNIGSVREMIDGGRIMIRTNQKFEANFGVNFASSATVSSLSAIWVENKNFIFCPFPQTYTAYWDGFNKAVIWTNDFDFNLSDNIMANGYSGNISLSEIPI